MIKVSDYIARYLIEQNIHQVFMVTGGGAMHLNDSLGKQEGLQVVFNHHEQACAMAAESYARLTNHIGVVNVTTGPGGLNALNGVFGAWTDSIPMLVLSGQVRYDTTVRGSGLPLRQMGDQEFDIVTSVESMTKYAVMVTDPTEIKFHLQKALYLAAHGRPGPVWLDIPMNVQSAMIDETTLRSYDFPAIEKQEPPVLSSESISLIWEKIQQAERPVMLVGTGVRLSGAYDDFLKLVQVLKIPVATAFNAHDVLTDDNPYYAGRPGTVGDRAGNLVVQNADVLLVLGCRLNIRQIGYHWESFARGAYKIVVEIDPVELKKPTVSIDLPIHGDIADVVQQMLQVAENKKAAEKPAWLDWCKSRQKKYPVVLEEYWQRKELVDPYCFIQTLSQLSEPNQIVVTANATACITAFQAWYMKPGQRLFSNSGSASMGYDLPAAIGAAVGAPQQKIICLAGDGSIQMNLQELATIAQHQFPIKIFLLNNQGYFSIRQTQGNFFGKPYLGIDTTSGLFFPDMTKLAEAYGIRYARCLQHADLHTAIASTLANDDPVICEVFLTIERPFSPKASSKRLADGRMVSRPLEDLAPFLSREELADNMFIDLLPESVE